MKENSTQYQYQHIELETVMKNIDEYIIPECQEACKRLWDKNIETFMVSNQEDDHLYVLVNDLSNENTERIKKLIEEYPQYYFFDEYRHFYGIKILGKTQAEAEILTKLIEPFLIQDVLRNRYQTADEFLEDYKSFSINDVSKIQEIYHLSEEENIFEIDERGNVGINQKYVLNPEKANATLEEALEKTSKKELYDSKEGKIYSSPMFMEWHKRYINSKYRHKVNEEFEKDI